MEEAGVVVEGCCSGILCILRSDNWGWRVLEGFRTNIFLNMWFWPWYGHGSWSVGRASGSGSRGPGPANLSGGGKGGGQGRGGERTIGVFEAHALPYSCLPSGDLGAGGGG